MLAIFVPLGIAIVVFGGGFYLYRAGKREEVETGVRSRSRATAPTTSAHSASPDNAQSQRRHVQQPKIARRSASTLNRAFPPASRSTSGASRSTSGASRSTSGASRSTSGASRQLLEPSAPPPPYVLSTDDTFRYVAPPPSYDVATGGIFDNAVVGGTKSTKL